MSETTGQGDAGQGGFGQHKEHEEVEEQHAARAGGRARGLTRPDAEPADRIAGTAAPTDEAPADAAAAQADAEPAGACHGHGARGEAAALRDRLLTLGVAGHVADDLLARHPVQRIGEALEVAAAHAERNAAGWIVTALRDDWDLSERLARVRAAEARRRAEHAAQSEHELRARAAAVERERAEGWSAAIAAALDDAELDAAIERVTTPAGGVGRRSAPLVRAQLIAWAVHAARGSPERPLAEVLRGSLADGAAPAPALDGDGDLPPPPPVPGAATAPGDLMERIRTRLSRPP